MVDGNIDLDRGVTKRTHPNGMQVCMYKDDPGVFYDVLGNELEDDFAEECGFNVADLAVEREKLKKLNDARLKIEKEYANVSGDIVEMFGKYQVVCVDEKKNQYNVVSGSSTKPNDLVSDFNPKPINDKYLSKEQAIEFANSLKKKQ